MTNEAAVHTEKGRRDAYRIATGSRNTVRKVLAEHRLPPLAANQLAHAANGLERLIELLALPVKEEA